MNTAEPVVWRYLPGKEKRHALVLGPHTDENSVMSLCGTATFHRSPWLHGKWRGDANATERAILAKLPACQRCTRMLAARSTVDAP